MILPGTGIFVPGSEKSAVLLREMHILYNQVK